MDSLSEREAALVVACREWAADTGQTGMFIEFIGGFNAAWAAGRAELEDALWAPLAAINRLEVHGAAQRALLLVAAQGIEALLTETSKGEA